MILECGGSGRIGSRRASYAIGGSGAINVIELFEYFRVTEDILESGIAKLVGHLLTTSSTATALTTRTTCATHSADSVSSGSIAVSCGCGIHISLALD